MQLVMPSRTVSVAIACPAEAVYDFLVAPEHLPAWAPRFAHAVRHDRHGWVVDTTEGPMRIDLAPRNPYGVVDQHITIRPGLTVVNQIRAASSGDRAEELLTPVWGEEITERLGTSLAIDERDLQTLKRLLEAEEL